MFLKSSFGAVAPDALAVLAFAEATIRQLLPPDIEVERTSETVLRLRRGSHGVMWNLADVVRLGEPAWKEHVIDLASQVAVTAGSMGAAGEADEPERPFSLASVVVLVWPVDKIRGVPFAVEERLAPGLHLFYGLRGGGKIRNVNLEELIESSVSLATLRAHAVTNLGLTLESLDVGPLFEGAPILTNHEGSLVATSLFADPASCDRLAAMMGGDRFLVALPAPSRLFVAPDAPAFVPMLQTLIQRANETEESFLSSHVFRVSGHGSARTWETVSAN